MNRIETINGMKPFPLVCRYFELLSTVNPVDVVAYNEKGNVLHEERQVEAGYYIHRPEPLERIFRIEITTSANEAVKFIYTDGLSGNRSLSANVSDRATRLLGIVYGSLGQLVQLALNGVNLLRVHPVGAIFADDHTAAGEAAMLHGQQTGAAANNSHVQLKNPAASGKIVYVDKVRFGHGLATVFDIRFHNTDLTTDLGAGLSKDAGGTAPVAHLRGQNNGTVLGGTLLASQRIVANADAVFEFVPPLRLEAGEGVLVADTTQNETVRATYEWRERAV